MKKITLLILFLFLSGAGIYYYFHKSTQETALLETLVPEDAILLYNSSNFIADFYDFDTSEVAQFLYQFEVIQDKKKVLKSILSLIPKTDFSLSFSAHKSANKEFELIYYFNDNQQNIIGILDILAKKEHWKKEKRKLDGINITEHFLKGETVLSYCVKDGWLVMSKSPYLLEEVIRNNYQHHPFKNYNWIVFTKNAKSFLQSFFKNNTFSTWFNFKEDVVYFDFKFNNNEFKLIGLTNKNNNSYINQPLISFQEYIPISASLVQKEENKLRIITDNEQEIIVQKVNHKVNFLDTIYTSYNFYPLREDSDLFYVKVNSVIEVVGKSKVELIRYLEALENEDVWGKSLKMKSFIEQTVDGAQNSVFINLNLSISYLFNELESSIKEDFSKHIPKFKMVDFISLQKTISSTENLYEWLVIFKNNKKNTKKNVEINNQSKEYILYTSVYDPITKPYLVRNHITSAQEFIFQDSLFSIHLVGNKGQLNWSKSVESELVTDIKQVDIYRNGKLQYIFATKNKIYIVDRNGEDIENYPITINSKIKFLSIFDYDKDKKYRFLITTEEGNYLMYNTKKELLSPWNPLTLNGIPLKAPEHIRVGNKDIILIVTNDNKVHLLNRRAEYYKGFPFLTSNNKTNS